MLTDAPQRPMTTGALLFVSYRSLENRVFRAIIEAGFTDLTLSQARIFQRIGPAGTRLTELAEQAQVTKQTTGFLVDQLENAGYVKRASDPTDARARLVRIASRGKAVQAVAQAAVERVEADWITHLGAARWAALQESLALLSEITDPRG